MSNNTIHREEMKETWDTTKNELQKALQLLEKPYKYANWITNLSFGLLGFYIAFLMQLKTNGAIESKIEVILTFLIIVTPIVLGFIFRIKHEVMDI
jgi:ABC-type molybdate transport system permease subunit